MDVSVYGLLCNWLPHLPSIVKTAVLAAFGYSENSKYQDVLTETIAVSARPIMRTPASLLQSQIAFTRDPGIFGRIWVSKYTVPLPQVTSESQHGALSVQQALAAAIAELDDNAGSSRMCRTSDLVPVETEWTGYRANVSHISRRPNISESAMYERMTAEVDKECPVVLYFHGGAHCLMDPSTHRWTTSSLAKECRGLVVSVRHRLSPQNVFPAALSDAFAVYLALICPPLGAFHERIIPSRLVLAGDSSGAGLATSLFLLLLTLRKQSISVRVGDNDVRIPDSPCAGLAVASPWFDVSRALPSTRENTRWDILAPPPQDTVSPPFPPDEIWPTSPPRGETYCTADMVTHPLVSPLAARPERWRGAPPVYICTGWEVFQDEVEVFARRVYQSSQKAVVRFEGYIGMPHCFMMVPWNRLGSMAMRHWGIFCAQTTSAAGVTRTEVGSWTDKYGAKQEVPLSELGMTNVASGYERTTPLDDEVVEKLMSQSREWRVKLEDEMVESWARESSN